MAGHRFWRMAPGGAALAVLLVLSVSKRAEAQDGPIWIRQFGTADYDYVRSLAIDGSGNVYTSGWTFGDLGGPQRGGGDTWVAKYSAGGVRLWTRQLGSAAEDNAFTMAADPAGTVYVSGRTNGALAGPYRGQGDVWIAAYDPAGRLLWTRQRGTPAYEGSYGMALDGRGNLYITGSTTGAFAGAHTGGGDAYLLKYSTAGTALWSRQLGTPARDLGWADAVAADGTIYVAGDTEGSLAAASQGASDVFLARYSPAGALLWVRQFGSTAEEQTRGTATDRAGNVYVAGWTSGALAGPSSGKTDAFLAKYSAGGEMDGATRNRG